MLNNKFAPKYTRPPAPPAAPDQDRPDNGDQLPTDGQPAAPRIELHGSFYDSHELLQMLNDLEDERRWARFREGILWAFLLHVVIIAAVLMLPHYIFVPQVVEPKMKGQQEWTYLDTPPVRPQPKKPLVQPHPEIDQKTMEEMRKQAPPTPKAEQPQPQPQQQQAEAPKPQIANPIPPAQQSQSQVETPKPTPVPAKPSFAFGSQNPSDQMRDAMRGSMRGSTGGPSAPAGGLSRHPGADTGGVQILSDTQGVDFNSWIRRWYIETKRTWDPLIPDEVNPPILKQGAVQVRFKVLPTGRVMDGSMVLEGRSGDVALDRAAWGAITGSNYPPLPSDFHGPYLELRALFMYNMHP